ncbi:MAG: hypothetical protein OXH81_13665 [Gemmatimonadetes bacterium]|nr:hypothetical protein [Gemmatimonadota bacterium]
MGTRSEVIKQLPIAPTLGFRFFLDDAVCTSLPTAMHVSYDRWKSLQCA